jgi:hypothetical protein
MLALTGAGLAGGAVAAAVTGGAEAGAASTSGESAAGALLTAATTGGTESSSGEMITVPAPTGTASTDTANILKALSQAKPGTAVFLQCLTGKAAYVIDQELPIPRGVHLTSQGANTEGWSGPPSTVGGYMATLQQAAGSSLVCTVASAAYLAGLYGPSNPGKYPTYNALYNNGTPNTTGDSAVEIDHIAFDGQNGQYDVGNTKGHAVVLFSKGSKVHDLYLFDTAQVGIVISDANYAGSAGTEELLDNRIYDNKIYNPGEQGILVTDTTGSGGCHSGYLLNNNIVSNSKQVASTATGLNINPSTGAPYEAVRLENAAGWWVVNNHPYEVPGNAWYVAGIWGLHFIDNSTDDFGAVPTNGSTYVGHDFYLSEPTENTPPALLPAFIHGNQISAYEGLNTNNHSTIGNHAANNTNTFLYYRVTMKMASQQNPMPASYIDHSDNSAHQDSQPAGSVGGAKVTSGSSTVTFGSDLSDVVQSGMSITDSAGHIPAGTFIGTVSPNGLSATLVNEAGSPVTATGSSSDDTVSFPGPKTVGWTYVNELSDSTLVVCRTNELITPTISESPGISGAGSVTLIDPANLAGGVVVTGPAPEAGQTIVATSANRAAWGSPPAAAPSGEAGGVLGGTYPNPSLAPTLSTTMTASGTYVVPEAATRLRITCAGGGGGGGGGGASGSGSAQAGGSGGAAGTTSVQVLAAVGRDQLVVSVGRGGVGGSGGAAGGNNPGGNGSAGESTAVTGNGISVRGSGGGGGHGADAGSTEAALGPAYGAPAGVFTAITTGGSGGVSGQAGGYPLAASPGGGGGGGAAGRGRGGNGGAAGTALDSGAAGAGAGGLHPSGVAGDSATDPGAGGGGGGGGTNGGGGGSGGDGAPGFVTIEVVG